MKVGPLEISKDEDQSISLRLGEEGETHVLIPNQPGYDDLNKFFPTAKEELPHLIGEQNDIWSFLLRSETGNCLGMQKDFRQLVANVDQWNLVLCEMVSGDDRYPPGRCTRIPLKDEDLQGLFDLWRYVRRTQEERRKSYEASRSTHMIPSDDFDPFLDSDDLP